MISSGELTAKIVIKSDHKREDGTHKLYLQCFVRGEKVMLPLDLAVPLKDFDKKGQRVKKSHPHHGDINLVLEKARSKVFQIGLDFRLRDKVLTRELLRKEYFDPTPNTDFLAFCKHYHEQQRGYLEEGTWRGKNGTLKNLEKWREELLFSELSVATLKDFIKYLRQRNLKESTVQTQIKNVKTWLYAAQASGLNIPFNIKDLKVRHPRSMVEHLTQEEVRILHRYYNNEFCPDPHRKTLKIFLFGCFTGMRYQDIADLTWQNIDGDRIMFVPRKTQRSNKVVSFRLPQKAIELLDHDHDQPFLQVYTNQVANRYLKEIGRMVGVKKRIKFHMSRHTFATIFLEMGGNIEVLKELLAHTNIRETMIYVSVTNTRKDDQVANLDNFL
ncbi:MAG: site-specific integrase [Bacteroidota bacterium]|nr:site-specific integrase [Bacteroidota bacterium]